MHDKKCMHNEKTLQGVSSKPNHCLFLARSSQLKLQLMEASSSIFCGDFDPPESFQRRELFHHVLSIFPEKVFFSYRFFCIVFGVGLVIRAEVVCDYCSKKLVNIKIRKGFANGLKKTTQQRFVYFFPGTGILYIS